jgi:hypothetical protein
MRKVIGKILMAIGRAVEVGNIQAVELPRYKS